MADTVISNDFSSGALRVTSNAYDVSSKDIVTYEVTAASGGTEQQYTVTFIGTIDSNYAPIKDEHGNVIKVVIKGNVTELVTIAGVNHTAHKAVVQTPSGAGTVTVKAV